MPQIEYKVLAAGDVNHLQRELNEAEGWLLDHVIVKGNLIICIMARVREMQETVAYGPAN